ncbi:unnamed protein product [Allacma fusca]|uniref:Uncharacterized protein n=1 Tax=Allacma fusca TaxID=39272 RepID=A0A8J2JUK9_9HEXA|nr:unnamed protein product [Allacma fusca]
MEDYYLIDLPAATIYREEFTVLVKVPRPTPAAVIQPVQDNVINEETLDATRIRLATGTFGIAADSRHTTPQRNIIQPAFTSTPVAEFPKRSPLNTGTDNETVHSNITNTNYKASINSSIHGSTLYGTPERLLRVLAKDYASQGLAVEAADGAEHNLLDYHSYMAILHELELTHKRTSEGWEFSTQAECIRVLRQVLPLLGRSNSGLYNTFLATALNLVDSVNFLNGLDQPSTINSNYHPASSNFRRPSLITIFDFLSGISYKNYALADERKLTLEQSKLLRYSVYLVTFTQESEKRAMDS